MTPRDIPVVSAVVEAGADDRVFDSLLLVGPVVIVLVAVLERSLATELLAAAYVTVFTAYVLYRGAAEGAV